MNPTFVLQKLQQLKSEIFEGSNLIEHIIKWKVIFDEIIKEVDLIEGGED
jgi:hypothetical protein